MALTPGNKLGPYEIVSLLGTGGMGEVYRARDSRLNRDVALKVSGSRFNERFEQEARAVAALNHPNICSLFDVGPDYLVMELVEGATLADRIDKGPVGVDEAMDIARQIAAGLEAAHEKGITHRDLKPANIKITPGGLVKVLDFGLAKVQAPAEPVSRPSESPTLTMRATEAGMILGTAGYMSPEQARGETVDKRADIWAYGVVLYEMVTGKTLFQGPTVADTLAAVLVREPDLNAVPERLRPLVAACLERNLKKRLRDIGEAWRFLEAAPAVVVPAVAESKPAWLAWAVAAMAVLGAGAFEVWQWGKPAAPAPGVRFEIPPPEGLAQSSRGARGPFAISPDGTQIVIGSPDRIWIRGLGGFDWRALPPVSLGNTFIWSRDGKFLVFRSGENLVRMSVTGGTPQVLCSVSDGVFNGGFWSKDDRIVFAISGVGIKAVSANGGMSAVLFPGGAFPSPLPDGDHFVYGSGTSEEEGVFVASLKDPRERKRVVAERVSQVAYAAAERGGGGHLVYVRAGSGSGTLVAQPFDERRLETTGEPVPLAEPLLAQRSFSVAANGTLVYRLATGESEATLPLRWVDRQGRPAGTVEGVGLGFVNRRTAITLLSPDGKRLVFEKRSNASGETDLWIYEFARGVSTRLTMDGMAYMQHATWSAEGGSVYFTGRAGTIFRKAVLGAGEAELILELPKEVVLRELSSSGDGRFLLYAESVTGRPNASQLSILPLEGPKETRKPFPYLNGKFGQAEGRFYPSLKGAPRWVAYTSTESGRPEIYVRAFDPANRTGEPAGEKWQVSRDGGIDPRWRGDGKELYFSSPDGNLMAADVITNDGPSFRTGPAKALFLRPGVGEIPNTGLGDVSGDGKRFLFAAPEKQTGAAPMRLPPLRVMMNWQAGLGKE